MKLTRMVAKLVVHLFSCFYIIPGFIALPQKKKSVVNLFQLALMWLPQISSLHSRAHCRVSTCLHSHNMFITDKDEEEGFTESPLEQWKSTFLCLKLFSVELWMFGASDRSGHSSSRRMKAKKRKEVLWAVCDKWLLWAKICEALVYSWNIMYHKFHLHFSSSQITFYPIRWCFLCWLKGTLKQTVLLPPPLHLSLLLCYSISSLFLWLYFSLLWLVSRIFSIILHQSLSSHPLTLHFHMRGGSHNAEQMCKCAAFVCSSSTQVAAAF